MSHSRSFAIVPAAGVSARMAAPKLLLPWRGKTILEHALNAWIEGGIDQVAVVVRAGDSELAALARRCGAEVVPADPPPADMKASVRAGLSHVAERCRPTAADVWLTAPADLPRLSGEVIRRLLAAHDAAAPRALVACHKGRRGHPVLFPWHYAAQLDGLAANEGVNRLVERAAPAMIECGERAVCADLDTPDDYDRLQRELREDGLPRPYHLGLDGGRPSSGGA